jgi:hypothetical protein
MIPRYAWAGATVSLLLALVCCGCRPADRPGHLTGKVRFRGKELPSGTVCFLGANGKKKYAPIAEDGTYKVAGVPQGTARVGVESHPRLPPGFGGPRPGEPGTIVLPPHYTKPETSGLTYEVKGGQETFDIDLQAGGR